MKFRLYVFIAPIALAVITADPAAAIIGGQPDGNRHPNVGALDLRPIGFAIPCSGTLISPTVYVTAGHCTNFLSQPQRRLRPDRSAGQARLLPLPIPTAAGAT